MHDSRLKLLFVLMTIDDERQSPGTVARYNSPSNKTLGIRMHLITQLTLPSAGVLRDKLGWQRHPLYPDCFYATRVDLTIRYRQHESSQTQLGNIVDSFSAVPGVCEKITRTFELDQHVGLVEESLYQHVRENLYLDSFSSELGVHANMPAMGSLSMVNKVLATHNFKQALIRNDKIQMTHTRNRKITQTRTYETQATGQAESLHFVVAEAYVQWVADVYLQRIDYLSVCHRKSPFGKKYKTTKHPEVIAGKHANVIKVGAPLFRVLYWRLLEDSFVTVPMTEYRNAVGNSLDLQITEVPAGPVPYAPESASPTLYSLASEAFPGRRPDLS